MSRRASLAYIVAFLIAGAYVATLLDGQTIVGAAHSFAPSNPLLKSVEVARGAWLHNYQSYPALWLAPGIALLGALLTWILLGTARKGAAFIASSLVQTGTIFTAGIALFPFLMPSSTHRAARRHC